MAQGLTGRFFAQLVFLLRQKIPMMDALDLLAGSPATPEWTAPLRRMQVRMKEGEFLWTALAELPNPFSSEVAPIVEQLESEGLLVEQLEVLAAWPDRGVESREAVLARIFAHASLLVHTGRPIAEALRLACRPGDPADIERAFRVLSQTAAQLQSVSESMSRFPDLFSPAVRRVVQQMELNGTAESAFRELALAFSRGWFAAGTVVSPQA